MPAGMVLYNEGIMMDQERDYKAESMREFDEMAGKYDAHSPLHYRLTRLCDAAILKRLATFDGVSSILDVGCGTGALLEKIRFAYPQMTLNGVDLSLGMLNIAKKRNIPRVAFAQGDAEYLPYRDGSFDVVLCCSSFHHYPHPNKALAEFRRVLRPKGIIMICDMDLPLAARMFANHVLFPGLRTGDVHVYSSFEIKKRLEECGFVQCRVDSVTPFQWLATAKVQNLHP